VILKQGDGNPRLAGFVATGNGGAPPAEPESLISIFREHLKKSLPDYMIPSSITVIDAMPLTPNGKIDRNALAGLETDRPHLGYIPPRDRIELELVQIWEEILCRRPIGICDSFFDMGGHSLLALKLIDRIQICFDCRIPLRSLFLYPTVEQMASRLREEEIIVTGKSLIPIQSKGDHKPFFCIPGTGGTAFYLHALSSCLGPDQPFYSLQPPGMDGEEPLLDTIEELATAYTNHIKEAFSLEGYRLGGHSFGGIVAFEMARQMEAMGDRVEVVVIFDTPAPGYQDTIPNQGFDELGSLMDIVGIHEAWHGCNLGICREHLEKRMDSEAQLELVAGGLQKTGIGLYAGMSRDRLKRILRIYQAHTRAHACYRSRHCICAPIVLLQAEDVLPGQGAGKAPQSPDWGWGRFTKGGVFIEGVPGNHVNMMNLPHVEVLAQKLLNHLTK
jgi:thioesterase domain-containing protein/acyl carrier protein